MRIDFIRRINGEDIALNMDVMDAIKSCNNIRELDGIYLSIKNALRENELYAQKLLTDSRINESDIRKEMPDLYDYQAEIEERRYEIIHRK